MRLVALVCGVWLLAATAFADEQLPLHQRIDALLQKEWKDAAPAPRSDDATFHRRVALDLAGRIPTAQATRDFLANQSADKRRTLIDAALAAPAYADRMADGFNVHLMERRGENPEFSAYLKASFTANKPWDQMAREMLNPDADNEGARAAGFFLSKRLENYGQNPIDYPGLTRDVGRLFLGVDLQCAECHNHLFIEDYKQVDFQGLFAVYRNTYVRTDVKFPAVGEREMPGKWEFASVFDPAKNLTGPRVPGGKDFDVPAPSQPATAKKNPKTAPPRPAFSGVDLLAREIANSSNRQFARNAVNRLWFLMIGRGIVHPLDLHHAANKPSHPELLELLTTEFVAHNFDIKWFVRELALTDAYQRSTKEPVPDQPAKPETFRVGLERRLSAEQLVQSVALALGESAAAPQATAPASGEPAKAESPKTDPAKTTGDTTAPTLDQLKKSFAAAFANDARDPEESVNSTVKGALFWRNDEGLVRLLKRRPGNLLDRLNGMTEPEKLVDELFLSVLARLPEDSERSDFVTFIKQSPSREIAIRDTVWALLSSVEFFVNH